MGNAQSTRVPATQRRCEYLTSSTPRCYFANCRKSYGNTNCTGDIPLASLPQILQEFAEIGGWLGVRYLLIDPLRVYQDSAADRKQEASIMGDTYGGALINMAATDAGAAGGWDDYAAARTGPPVGLMRVPGGAPIQRRKLDDLNDFEIAWLWQNSAGKGGSAFNIPHLLIHGQTCV
ncbi:hypothetical protein MGG_16347 [Pyricularia oryzae 70-15]|uniref:Heterokaryon incompatibility domain-containing protein n=1 Tax=Pyricularia oryzae (strain 70-15 / ATCC MYA-4617 / FGSC 8958) TaxID=242507 RepID=G4MLA6_PYRO7|nr:uncharacterized protein MGG_16347 [Pyricularia oryzae 70-15]EHA57636.1 hypothetical protein MGG_16347 [Pyricularia oryzae 70-15]